MTEDYRPETPSGPPPERARVALVVGSGSVAADDLYDLHRRRLLVLNAITAAVSVAGLGINILALLITPGDDVPHRLSGLGAWLAQAQQTLVMLVVSSTAVVLLWRRPPAV